MTWSLTYWCRSSRWLKSTKHMQSIKGAKPARRRISSWKISSTRSKAPSRLTSRFRSSRVYLRISQWKLGSESSKKIWERLTNHSRRHASKCFQKTPQSSMLWFKRGASQRLRARSCTRRKNSRCAPRSFTLRFRGEWNRRNPYSQPSQTVRSCVACSASESKYSKEIQADSSADSSSTRSPLIRETMKIIQICGEIAVGLAPPSGTKIRS